VSKALESENIPFEFIVMDDGSKDNSYKVALELEEKDDRVRAYQLSKNYTSHYSKFAAFCAAISVLATPPNSVSAALISALFCRSFSIDISAILLSISLEASCEDNAVFFDHGLRLQPDNSFAARGPGRPETAVQAEYEDAAEYLLRQAESAQGARPSPHFRLERPAAAAV